VFASDTSRTVYLDGGNSASSSTSRVVNPSNFNRIGVATGFDSTGPIAAARGYFAEAAVWAVALTADEISQLAAGYSPLLVRPGSLRFYAPLFGRGGANADEEDWAGGLTLTQSSSPTVVDHPRIIYPSRRQLTQTVDATVGATIDALVGAATAEGQAAAISLGLTIDAAIAAATAAGRDATISLGSGGTGATAEEIWSYVMSNGYTAEENVVLILEYLNELHLIHGLRSGLPLTVTATSRDAGVVAQTIDNVAGTVTVTRT